MSEKRFKVAIVGLGFGAEFIPIYQAHPLADMYAICQRSESKLTQVGETFDVAHAILLLRRRIEGLGSRFRAHQHADPGPRPDVTASSPSRQTRNVHRPDGHHDRGMPRDRRSREGNGPEIHDGRNRSVQPGVPVPQRYVTRRASWAKSSIWPPRTRRTWKAGRSIGSE